VALTAHSGRKIYEPPRYMSIPTAVEQLVEVEGTRAEGVLVPEETLAIALARVGGVADAAGGAQTLVAGTLAELLAHPADAFGPPLHSLVLVGRRLHHLEVEYAAAFAVDAANWRRVAQDVYGCALE
jgi:diphthine synthase